MAAGMLPRPGTEYGPCLKACEHLDCAETRRMALAKCDICGKPIDFETRFYRRPMDEARDIGTVLHDAARQDYVLVHAAELEDEIEAEQRPR